MIRLIFQLAFQPEIMRRAIIVALVVGVLLNMINQGDRILEVGIQGIHWGKFLLTFCVPFLVSMFTAVSMLLQFKPGDRAPVTVNLSCQDCQTNVLVEAKQVIPSCGQCKQDTHWQFVKTDHA